MSLPPQNTEEWLAWRIKGLGASDSAAVLGVCKFKTAYELWLEKTGREPGFEGNAATQAGNEMEPKARSCYEIEHDFVEMPPACVVHPEHEVIRASLDGLREPDKKVILEIKYPSEKSHQEALEGRVPEHYVPQTQHQLMCVPEAEELHYWSFRDGKGAKVIVKPDPEYQAKLIEALLAFWELVLSDTPPPLTDRDAKRVDDETAKQICEELLKLKGLKDKSSKSEADQLKADLIELAEHSKVRCGSVLVSRSITKTGKTSYRMTVRGDYGT